MTYPAMSSLSATDKKAYETRGENNLPKALTEYKTALETILECPTCLQRFRNNLKENGKISDSPDQRSQPELTRLYEYYKEHTPR
jgi:hypothetical protein